MPIQSRHLPQINDETKEVELIVNVEPGPWVYVRNINFSGNVTTKDEVLRREMRQMEGTWLSSDNVEQSRPVSTGSASSETAEVDTKRVPGSDDQVDLGLQGEGAARGVHQRRHRLWHRIGSGACRRVCSRTTHGDRQEDRHQRQHQRLLGRTSI